MRKRISIFAGLLALLVGAIAFAAMGTGAYFTDSESGVISANSSNLSIEGTGTQSLDMAFDNLLPGATGQHKTVTFRNNGDSPVKVFLRQHAVSGIDGLSAAQRAQLSIAYQGDIADANGYYWAPGLNASLTPAGAEIAPGKTFTVGVDAQLQPAAGNEWQNRKVTMPIDVIAQQVDAPAPSA